MDDRVRDLLRRITSLEDELRGALAAREDEVRFKIEGGRIRFEHAVEAAHRRLNTGAWRYLREAELQSLLSAPFIYAMVVPIVLLDLALSLYQWTCFPLYRMPKVARADYFLFDRSQLAYLNAVEKLNCAYCSYANGVFAFAREVGARTEQYWCPVKHARKLLGAHPRYALFADYGDGDAYHAEARRLRAALRDGG